MKLTIAIALLACSLSAGAMAQQTQADPSAKTSDGKAVKAKKEKAGKSSCSGMQGGVDASGGESIEQHSKASKATAGNSTACGKNNGKAATPEAAPTTAHPELNDPVLK